MGKVTMKNLTDDEFLSRGSLSCPGCGALLVIRHALKVLGPNTLFVNPTGCGAVIMQMAVPKVPHVHPLFENGPALASGMDAALEVMGKRDGVNIACIAGDGAMADIGLGSLSGAVERGHRVLYICYDNESYMNTGAQRSGTTPEGAATSTTPVGAVIRGEERPMRLRKDVAEMMVAQGCPYVATASIAYPLDMMNKVKKAAEVDGPSYIHCHASCDPGWGLTPGDTVEVCRLAVKTGLVLLWEQTNGVRTYQHLPRKRVPVAEYFRMQKRFRHLLEDSGALERHQAFVDERLAAIAGE
jgi:pyruvate ferredoxin oxidoreductase beta subunit